MTVVVYELTDDNEFEELGRSYDDGQTDEALFGIYPKETWEEESDKWLVERLDGPYVIGEILDEDPGEEMDKHLEKFWTEYVGPEGGEGWQNLMTGEVRYQDEQPVGDDGVGHNRDVREPESDSEFSTYDGISDGSLIRDNIPVTAKFTDEEGTARYGEIIRSDVGGFRSEFVVAAANGRQYHIDEDDIEGYIEPDPEWDPESDNEDRMWQSQFEGVEEELGDETIPPVPSRDMGTGGDTPDTNEFNHIGDGKLTEEHVRVLQNAIDTGDLEALSVDFAATGDDVDYGAWDSDISSWHNGGQFAHVDVEMPVEDFLATQVTMLATSRDHPVQAHRSFYGSARPDDVKEYADVLENDPGELPMPFIELGQHGRLRNYQEGRHRALAASYAGHDTLPVRMVINAEREGKHQDERVQWPRTNEKSTEKAWIPYQGPQGGEGWQNAENPEDVRYQDEPPGEIEPGYEEMAEDWGEANEDDEGLDPEEWVPGEIAETVEEIPDSQWEETESMADLSPGDYAILDHSDADRRYPARIVDADESGMSFVTTAGLNHITEVDSEFMMGWELGEHAPPPGQGVEELPEHMQDDYDAENITPIEQLGDPSDWGGEFPVSPGQSLLGNAWEFEIDNAWFDHSGEPRLELVRDGTTIGNTFGYVSDPDKLGDLEPGWYRNPAIPTEDNRKEFIGVIGEPTSYEFGFEPSDGVAANNEFDLHEAADNMAEAVAEERYENTDASMYAASLIEENDADYNALLELAEHGIEANGSDVDESRDINEAEEIALNGVKRYLHDQAEDHPTLDGKLSLGFVSEELHEDFQSRMTPETRGEVSNVMEAWVQGFGSMVEEDTIPLYALADEQYENDFYPTRDDVGPLLENADNLEERKERVERYRQKTIEVFREQWGDTVPVFRGYNPDSHSKGQEAREALQSEDGPDTIGVRNGVANSWSTDPTVAYQFSQWTNEDEPGVVVRQELPVEQIFGASDTAPDLMGKETEIIAGNPKEVSEHDRDDVFLPEEFDALEQAKWALERAQGDSTTEDDQKADGDTLHLDWELSSVGWMNEHAALEDALLTKNWLPVEDDEYAYQHIDSGEMVVNKNVEFSATAAKAGYTPAREILAKGRLSKKWVPYRGPQGGEGWQNVNYPGDIRYQEDPPGEVLEGYEEWAEGWGDINPPEDDKVQGAEIVEYNVPNADQDIKVPKNFTAEDLELTLRRFREGEGDLSMMLENTIAADNHMDRDDKTDVLRATSQVLGAFAPDRVDEFNDLLHDHIRDHPKPDFDTPFGLNGPDIHDLLEETFGRHSDIVGDLEESILFDDSVNEENPDAWVVGAQEWIRNNGDRRMADEFEATLNAAAAANPFTDVPDADVPDHMDPAKAETVTPITDTEAETGISANSMFIAQFEDGNRAFVTNTSWDRASEIDGVDSESPVDAKRAMAGYNAYRVADMDVPRHEHVKDEYWTVEEAEGEPAKEWSGNPEKIDEEQFYKMAAVGMLSGNWDLHGGNVFVGDDGKLIPVDLDLSAHMLTDDYQRSTAWGRLERLAHKLGLHDQYDTEDKEAMKYHVARKTQELVEEGVADDIKSMASRIDHDGLQMNIEENVFAAKGKRLYDDEVWEKPDVDPNKDTPDGPLDAMEEEFDNLGGEE